MALFTFKHDISSAFTLNDGKDYALFPGGTYELPADNEHIASLIDQGYLVPVEGKAKAYPKQTDKQNTDKS